MGTKGPCSVHIKEQIAIKQKQWNISLDYWFQMLVPVRSQIIIAKVGQVFQKYGFSKVMVFNRTYYVINHLLVDLNCHLFY